MLAEQQSINVAATPVAGIGSRFLARLTYQSHFWISPSVSELLYGGAFQPGVDPRVLTAAVNRHHAVDGFW